MDANVCVLVHVPACVFVHVRVLVCVTPVDMWSVGCIFGEVIRGTVLFPGTDRILLTSRRSFTLFHI